MSDKGVQVIDRALDILEILSLEREGLGVTEIGARLGLHKSTVHRIISALAERGYIEKQPRNSIYKIGLKLIEISSVYLNNVELKTEARPYLNELTRKLGITSHIAILDGRDAVYIDKVDTHSSIRLYSQIGKRIPVHSSGLGKSLLAGLSDLQLEEYLKNYEFNKYTKNTITNKEDLIKQIMLVRKKGWSVDNEEHDDEIRCIASPILDYRGKVIAALSVAGPKDIVSGDRDEEIGEIVKLAAREISKRMGYSS